MSKELSLKQRGFIKEYLSNGGNSTRAVLSVYNTKDRHVAQVIGSENLSKPVVVQQLRRNLESSGLTDELLNLGLREIIEAGIDNKDKARPSDSLKGIELAHQLKGRLSTQKHLIASVNLTPDYEAQTIPELKKQLEEIQEANRKILLQLEN